MPSAEAIARKARMLMKKAKRESREQEFAAKIRALPQKQYGVILADAGWRFEPYSRETGMDRAADNHYVTSTTEIIKAIDVASIAAPDCVLYLWATRPEGRRRPCSDERHGASSTKRSMHGQMVLRHRYCHRSARAVAGRCYFRRIRQPTDRHTRQGAVPGDGHAMAQYCPRTQARAFGEAGVGLSDDRHAFSECTKDRTVRTARAPRMGLLGF